MTTEGHCDLTPVENLPKPEKHMPQNYSSQETEELGYLDTNFYPLLVENCFWGLLILWYFWPALREQSSFPLSQIIEPRHRGANSSI